MDKCEKKLFLRVLDDVSRLALAKHPDRAIIIAETENLKRRFAKLLELVQTWKKTEHVKDNIEDLEEKYGQGVMRLIWMKKQLSDAKNADSKLPIINRPLNSQIKSSEVVLYACKISSFSQAAPGSRPEDTLNPWSFGPNTVGIPEIEQSGMYLMYKNNPEYKRLTPPTIFYIQGTHQHIKEQISLENYTVLIKSDKPLVVSIKKDPSELVVYTFDGSEPNSYDVNPMYPMEEVVSISEQYTTLKIKSYKAGFITSPTATFKFEILENFVAEGNNAEGGMQRPDAIDELGGIGDGYDDLFDSGGAYTSLHFQNSYSTPGQNQN